MSKSLSSKIGIALLGLSVGAATIFYTATPQKKSTKQVVEKKIVAPLVEKTSEKNGEVKLPMARP